MIRLRLSLTITTTPFSFLKKFEIDKVANSDSFWVHWFFNVCMRVSYVPNATILLVYIRAIHTYGRCGLVSSVSAQ